MAEETKYICRVAKKYLKRDEHKTSVGSSTAVSGRAAVEAFTVGPSLQAPPTHTAAAVMEATKASGMFKLNVCFRKNVHRVDGYED